MPTFKFEYPHSSGIKRARDVVEEIISDNLPEFSDSLENLEKRWQNNTLIFSASVRGITVSGKLRVKEEIIEIEATLPFIALAFKSKIREAIVAELKSKL